MVRYILTRLLRVVFMFLATTLLVHWLVWAAPGEPFAKACGNRACPANFVETMNDRYHLDEPWPLQYARYMANLLTGDLGLTYSGQEVSQIIATAYPNTIKLALVAITFELLVGITAGFLTGLRRERFLEAPVLVMSLLLLAVPTFTICFLLQYLLGVQWRIIPPTVSSDAPLPELIVPGIALGAGSMALILRMTRTSITQNRHADYIRTAIAKGLPRRRVIGVHLLRNSLGVVTGLFSMELAALMGGSVVIETIFGINGVGGHVQRAINAKEAPTVVGLTIIITTTYLILNLGADLLHTVIDPRTHLE